MLKISIIMPVFNTEKYLPETLKSILRQTYKEFELLCIDDCSTDETGSIIKEFQKQDTRIRILTNEKHLGAAVSRNKGLKAAEGEYIIFLDGDDVFEEELLEQTGSAMEKNRADLVLFEYCHVPDKLIYTKKVVERPVDFREKYCRSSFSMIDFTPREFPWWAASSCNRMFRRSFLEEYGLEFQNLPSSNDVYFAQMSLFCAKRIICLDDRRVMVYARDHSEPQRISNHREPIYAYYALDKLCRELKERNMIGKYAPYLYYRLQESLRYTLKAEKDEERKRDFYVYLQKEGIANCIAYGKEYYGWIDEYDKYLLESFQNKDYESGWFEDPDTYFQCYLKKNGKIICVFLFSILESRDAEKQKIILWGAGVNGRILLRYLAVYSIRIFGVVDCDRSKQGTVIHGYKVEDPEALVRKADYILVTSKELYQDVCATTGHTKAVVVNLLDMLLERKSVS